MSHGFLVNLSKVDHLYIGKDTVVAFADTPEFKTYNIEITSEDKIKEHLVKPSHWVPQRHKGIFHNRPQEWLSPHGPG